MIIRVSWRCFASETTDFTSQSHASPVCSAYPSCLRLQGCAQTILHVQQAESDKDFPRSLSQQCKRKEKLKNVESSNDSARRQNIQEERPKRYWNGKATPMAVRR